MASAHTRNKKADRVDGQFLRPLAVGVTTGLMARWDVLRWIPFVGVGVGGYHFTAASPAIAGQHWGIPLKAGVEYLLSRSWIVSAQVSGHVVVRMETAGLDWAQFTVGLGPAWDF